MAKWLTENETLSDKLFFGNIRKNSKTKFAKKINLCQIFSFSSSGDLLNHILLNFHCFNWMEVDYFTTSQKTNMACRFCHELNPKSPKGNSPRLRSLEWPIEIANSIIQPKYGMHRRNTTLNSLIGLLMTILIHTLFGSYYNFKMKFNLLLLLDRFQIPPDQNSYWNSFSFPLDHQQPHWNRRRRDPLSQIHWLSYHCRPAFFHFSYSSYTQWLKHHVTRQSQSETQKYTDIGQVFLRPKVHGRLSLCCWMRR